MSFGRGVGPVVRQITEWMYDDAKNKKYFHFNNILITQQ